MWGFSSIAQIEIVYRKFIKTLLKINLYTPYVMVYGGTGTSLVFNVIAARMISLYARTLNGKRRSYLSYYINC